MKNVRQNLPKSQNFACFYQSLTTSGQGMKGEEREGTLSLSI